MNINEFVLYIKYKCILYTLLENKTKRIAIIEVCAIKNLFLSRKRTRFLNISKP